MDYTDFCLCSPVLIKGCCSRRNLIFHLIQKQNDLSRRNYNPENKPYYLIVQFTQVSVKSFLRRYLRITIFSEVNCPQGIHINRIRIFSAKSKPLMGFHLSNSMAGLVISLLCNLLWGCGVGWVLYFYWYKCPTGKIAAQILRYYFNHNASKKDLTDFYQ